MASTTQETSPEMNELYSFITVTNERNTGISRLIWGWGASTASDCLPIYIKKQRPKPPPVKSPQNLGKVIFSLTFQAILAWFIGFPTSSPSLPTVLFGPVMLISFAVSFAGVFLHNAFPRMAPLLEKFGALFAAIGVCIISSLLVHQNLTWICWLACGSCLLAFILSFK